MTTKALSVLLTILLATALLTSPAAAEPWKFVVMADSQGSRRQDPRSDFTDGVSTRTLAAVVGDVVKHAKPDLILFAGDLVQGAADAKGLEKQLMTFRKTMAPAYKAKIPVYAIRGSHDVGPNEHKSWSDAVWNKVFSGPYAMPTNGPKGEKGRTYSFTHKNAFFVGLGCYKTPNTRVLTINLPWVQKQLAANTQPHVFPFSHTQINRVVHSESLDNFPPMRNALVKMLRAAGGRAYFCGHMHLANITALNDDRADPKSTSLADDFFQVICPPSSQKFYFWDGKTYDGNRIPGMTPHLIYNKHRWPGYTLVEVDGAKVKITFMLHSEPAFIPKGSISYTVAAKKGTGD